MSRILFLILPAAAMLMACPKKFDDKVERLEYRRFKVEQPQFKKSSNLAGEAARVKAQFNRIRYARVAQSEAVCEQDADCMVTAQHCCSCNEGGKRVGVNRQFRLKVARRRLGSCDKVMCAQKMSDSPTCKSSVAKCVNKVCVVDTSGAPAVKGVDIVPIEEVTLPASQPASRPK